MYLAVIVALVISFGAFSCASNEGNGRSGSGVTSQLATSGAAEQYKKVAVLDFIDYQQPQKPDAPHICPVTNYHFVPGDTITGSGENVSDLFRLYLGDMGYSVVGKGVTDETVDQVYSAEKPAYVPAMAVEAGKALGVDAVFIGVVMRYEERLGSRIGADKPASVGFSVAMVGMSEQKIVWQAKFDKTQQPLFNNLFDFKTFAKDGFGWKTASELAGVGAENILDTLPFMPTGK